MQNLSNILDILKLIWPLVILQLGVEIYALVDLGKRGKTKNLSPIIWIFIILLINMIGAVVYLLVGRSDDE